jgi:hypothetical protein
MKISAASIAFVVVLAATAASAQLADSTSADVLELHGSGTTFSQQFFWKVMGILEERTQNAIKMTYRGVGACPVVYDSFGKIPPDLDLFPTSGSRTGQVDFMFDQNHFGSGDIPFKTDDYTTVTTTNSKPSSTSLSSSEPTVSSTPCPTLLARRSISTDAPSPRSSAARSSSGTTPTSSRSTPT